jgi:hypothetical protein
VAPAEHPVDVTMSATQATLMMTLCRPTPPRVMTLDVLVPVVLVVHVALAEHPVDVTVSATQATLMMTLWRPTPPRVMSLDVLVPVVPVVPVAQAEHPVDVTVSRAAALLDDDAMLANAASRDDTGCVGACGASCACGAG